MRARTPALAAALAAALGCGDTLVDHGAPIDLIGAPGGAVCDPAACPPPNPSFTGARAACIGTPGAQICGYECTGGLLKCSAGCCPATSVAAGGAHTCAITGNPAPGALYCWGSNDAGQVNTVPSGPVLTPQKRFESGVSAVALGTSHTCAIVNGSVTCWGLNSQGQAPVAVSLTSPDSLAAGAAHTCARDGNAARCWGAGSAVPSTVFSSGVSSISAGSSHTCALVSGAVQCWPAATNVPVQFSITGGAAAVAAGSALSCAASSSPSGPPLSTALQCWGSGLGALLPADPQPTPAIPSTLDGQGAEISLIDFRIALISVGGAHVCVKGTNPASVRCIGSDSWGQLGALPFTPPQAIDVPGTASAQWLAAGAEHSCAVAETGGLLCWGRNASGQLGDGTQITPGIDDAQPIGTPVAVSGR